MAIFVLTGVKTDALYIDEIYPTSTNQSNRLNLNRKLTNKEKLARSRMYLQQNAWNSSIGSDFEAAVLVKYGKTSIQNIGFHVKLSVGIN